MKVTYIELKEWLECVKNISMGTPGLVARYGHEKAGVILMTTIEEEAAKRGLDLQEISKYNKITNFPGNMRNDLIKDAYFWDTEIENGYKLTHHLIILSGKFETIAEYYSNECVDKCIKAYRSTPEYKESRYFINELLRAHNEDL